MYIAVHILLQLTRSSFLLQRLTIWLCSFVTLLVFIWCNILWAIWIWMSSLFITLIILNSLSRWYCFEYCLCYYFFCNFIMVICLPLTLSPKSLKYLNLFSFYYFLLPFVYMILMVFSIQGSFLMLNMLFYWTLLHFYHWLQYSSYLCILIDFLIF